MGLYYHNRIAASIRLYWFEAMTAENYRYQFVAGNLALDFINTVAYRLHPLKMKDHLQRADDVRQWASQARLPDRDAINSSPRLGRHALGRARAVREQLYLIFCAMASRQPTPNGALRQVDHALRECRTKRCLSIRGTEVCWTWRPDAGCSHFFLYPILTAASDLLTSVSGGLVRQCADEDCGWLFLDRSNARKRRWCSMADCGNRNKAREHYRRKAGAV
jgi:predicted RNA-binding Zn ribbon-like protein